MGKTDEYDEVGVEDPFDPREGGELYHDKTPTNNDTTPDPCSCGSSPKLLFSSSERVDNLPSFDMSRQGLTQHDRAEHNTTRLNAIQQGSKVTPYWFLMYVFLVHFSTVYPVNDRLIMGISIILCILSHRIRVPIKCNSPQYLNKQTQRLAKHKVMLTEWQYPGKLDLPMHSRSTK